MTFTHRNNLVIQYMPMLRRFAAQYAGRGADYDDLLQDAAMRLCIEVDTWLKKDCPQPLTSYLWIRLKRYTRDRAKAMRRHARAASLDAMTARGFAPPTDGGIALLELVAALTPEQTELARALLSGDTLDEIGARLRIPRRTLDRAVRKLKDSQKERE